MPPFRSPSFPRASIGFSYSELHRIAYMAACRELSERARGHVSTYGDEHRRPGELVDDALALVGRVRSRSSR